MTAAGARAFPRTRTGAGLLHAGFALAVSLLLLAPMLFTDRTLGQDWTNHLWAMYVQGEAIADGGPSLFLHTDGATGIFYPHYAFYGGSLYAIGGTLGLLLGGHPLLAYLLTWVAGFLMAYGGMLWLSFQAGLRGWEAHAAPLVLVTSAYYVGIAYAKGAWPELIATSAIPLVLAAAVSLLRAPRVSLGPAAAFVVGAILLTGSHNLTLVWGSVAIAALLLVGVVAIPSLRRISPRRVLVLCGLGALAIGVNAWFLLPDVLYASRTYLGELAGRGVDMNVSGWYDSPAMVFSLLRHGPSQQATSQLADYPVLYTQLPILILVWAAVVAALSVRAHTRGRVLWVAAGTAVVLAGFVALMMLNWPWQHLPKPLKSIQFTFRLESYALIATGLLVAALLRAIQLWGKRDPRLARGLRAVLAVALAFGFGQAVVQAWGTESFPLRAAHHPARSQIVKDAHKLPPYWASYADYGDHASHVIGAPRVRFDPNAVKDNRLDTVVQLKAGSPAIATNVSGGPYLVRITGARHIGRTEEGFQVVAPATTRGGHAAKLRVEPKSARAVVAGRWISLVALAGLLALLLFYSLHSSAKRRQPK
jgi:hypothetical protein